MAENNLSSGDAVIDRISADVLSIRKQFQQKIDRSHHEHEQENEAYTDQLVDSLDSIAMMWSEKIQNVQPEFSKVPAALRGLEPNRTLLLYDEFLEAFGNKLRNGTATYVGSARQLYAFFRGQSQFDWGLTIIELCKAFENEFRPRFACMAKREKANIEAYFNRGLDNQKNAHKELEKMTFNQWLGILRYSSKYPYLIIQMDLRNLLLSKLTELTKWRDMAAHADPRPLELTQFHAEEAAKILLPKQQGLIRSILPLQIC